MKTDNKSLNIEGIEELNNSEKQSINGGISPLGYWVLWTLGRMAATPAELQENGMNPVHLYN